MRKLYTNIVAEAGSDWRGDGEFVISFFMRFWVSQYSALNMSGLCNQIKYIKCYFESNNPRGETCCKHERGGSFPGGQSLLTRFCPLCR